MSQKNALVTGASEGIGRAFAVELAARGYCVTAVARNEHRLKELLNDLGSSASPHRYIVVDLSQPETLETLSHEFKTQHYDLLINNAGSGVYGKFSEVPLSFTQKMTRLNCDALVSLSHAFLTHAHEGDALINVSSILAFPPLAGSGVYSATKAFVTSFSESLWYEQKERGVFVMSLCPGVTSTEFHSRAGGLAAEKPSTRITQTPQEVVQIALKALEKRNTPTVVCGYFNQITTNLPRFIPKKTIINFLGRLRDQKKDH